MTELLAEKPEIAAPAKPQALPVPPQVVLDWQAMVSGETRSMKALTTPL